MCMNTDLRLVFARVFLPYFSSRVFASFSESPVSAVSPSSACKSLSGVVSYMVDLLLTKKGANKSTIKPKADLLTPSVSVPANGAHKFLLNCLSIISNNNRHVNCFYGGIFYKCFSLESAMPIKFNFTAYWNCIYLFYIESAALIVI